MQKLSKLYYTISEVAEMFGIEASTLRYWEREFKQLSPMRKAQSNSRRYTAKDIEVVQLIHMLVREQNLTIEGAKKALQMNYSGEMRQSQLLSRLKTVRQELLELRNAIDSWERRSQAEYLDQIGQTASEEQ